MNRCGSKLSICLALLMTHMLHGALWAASVDISASQDAQVVEGKPHDNFGAATYLYVNSASRGKYKNERAWLKFDLRRQLPPGAVITGAALRLYCWKADAFNNMWVAIYGSIDDSWSERGITWENQPAISAELGRGELQADRKRLWYEWDVTGFVQSQHALDQTVTLVVKPLAEHRRPGRTYAFDAREYSPSLVPRLRVEYSGSWPAGGGFKIFHMNDAHSRLLPHEFDVPETDDVTVFEKVGGAACFASKMLALKSGAPDSLILDAGDISEGNPLGDLRGNGGVVDFYNLLDDRLKALGGRGIDAVVVGNHDVRAARMLENLQRADFPVVSVNVCRKGTYSPFFAPYVTVVVNQLKVGILGYTNDESSYLGPTSENIVDIVRCVWEDDDPRTIDIKDWVHRLRNQQGCDVVVLLSHMGQRRICSGKDAVLMDTGGVKPPEVVVSGHWHAWTERVWQPATLNGKTIIAEAAAYFQYIGELELSAAGKLVRARKHAIRNAEIEPDPAVGELLARLAAEYRSASPSHRLDEVIGYSAVDLTLDKDKWWTVSEFPWSATNAAGAWITDAMQWKAASTGFECHLALQSGGGIRRDVPAGPLTYAQIYEVYPWQDDRMVILELSGAEIRQAIEDMYCGASISAGWEVFAEDGLVSKLIYRGSPATPGRMYKVAVSEYMASHEDWAEGKTAESTGISIREAIIEYTARFGADNPMYGDGLAERYHLDTELAGGFKAVVTMIADAESQPYYEAAFIRLLSAEPQTARRRNGYGLAGLVNPDGSINPGHQFSETMLYRSHLGFRDGYLKPGDIIEVWGEGGFYAGNPQLVDQSGIRAADEEFEKFGHDEDAALPEYYPCFRDFWDEWHENHFVKVFAEKTGDHTVRDSNGFRATVYRVCGYRKMPLPGEVGEILELTGAVTQRNKSRRFRCRSAVSAGRIAVSGYPPSSAVDPVVPARRSSGPVALTATASDPQGGSVQQVQFYYRFAPEGRPWTAWVLFAADRSAPWAADFAFPDGFGQYQFYSAAVDDDGNSEDGPVRADTGVHFRKEDKNR